jgi:hypothetical protein
MFFSRDIVASATRLVGLGDGAVGLCYLREQAAVGTVRRSRPGRLRMRLPTCTLGALAAAPRRHWRFEKAPEGVLHRSRGPFFDEPVNGRLVHLSGLPLAIRTFDPERIFEPVGNRQAAVLGALWHDTLWP